MRTLSRTQATPGNNLVLSLDIGLQEVAEQAFAGKRGALVAIEPSTGDVLAFVSAPSFDPNAFVDGIDQQTWDELNNSPDHPLLNRPLHSAYPPGSTYKPFMALAALTLHKRTPEWGFHDPGFYQFGGHTFRNDVPQGQGWIDMNRAIMVSNDTYFYMLAHDLGVDAIAKFMKPWGFGQLTGIDIVGESRGILPSTEWKKKAYHKPELQRWYEGETISLGIGQGYNSFTMLQLAHATATLADNGIIMRPHLVKEIENPITRDMRPTVPHESGRIDVSQADIDVVKRGMEAVTSNPSGTGYEVFRNAPYLVAGKTGTAQVYSLQGAKYHGGAIPERLRDHSLFIAFAPADHPTIAVATIVENGGWGASAAGPIVRRVLDYYLLQRGKPGALQAAVAQAASTTQAIAEPVVGASDAEGDTATPVRVAVGFKALPVPAVPTQAPHDASPPLIASDVVAATQSAAASSAPAVAAGASAPFAAARTKGGASAARAAAAPAAGSATSGPQISAVAAMRRLRNGAASGTAPVPHKRRTPRDAPASDALAVPRESGADAGASAAATPDASGTND